MALDKVKLAKYLALIQFWGADVLSDFDFLVQNSDLEPTQKLALAVMLLDYKKKPAKRIQKTLQGLLEDLGKTWEELGKSGNLPDITEERDYLIQLILNYVEESLPSIVDDLNLCFKQDGSLNLVHFEE